MLDKEQAVGRKGIFMIDASKGFMKDGNKNRLRHRDIHKIVDTFTRQIEIPKYSRMVPLSEISDPKNDFNLNIPRYIDSGETEDLQDIEAHLKGGIPNADVDALADYWNVLPTLRSRLFLNGLRENYCDMKVEPGHIKSTIFEHPEFTDFTETVAALLSSWKDTNVPIVKGLSEGSKPKQLIERISESILESFTAVRLIDPYDVYQLLMSYYAEMMQDDVYMIATEGWTAVTDGEPNTDLIPMGIIIARYFQREEAAIEKLESERENLSRDLEEMDEEHGGEDGLLFEAKTDKGKLTKASINARLKVIKKDKEAADEREALEKYLNLMLKEAVAAKRIREAKKAFDLAVRKKYNALTVDEIKTLVVDDKWMTRLSADVQSELDRVSQALTSRIKQLAERYAKPLPDLIQDVETLSARVDEHLRKMGFAL